MGFGIGGSEGLSEAPELCSERLPAWKTPEWEGSSARGTFKSNPESLLPPRVVDGGAQLSQSLGLRSGEREKDTFFICQKDWLQSTETTRGWADAGKQEHWGTELEKCFGFNL